MVFRKKVVSKSAKYKLKKKRIIQVYLEFVCSFIIMTIEDTNQNRTYFKVFCSYRCHYFESFLLPQLRGENDSKQSDELQAK